MTTINFQPVEYEKLSKFKKLALFIILIGPEEGSRLLAEFKDAEIEVICREIADVRIMDDELKGKILEEFTGVIGGGLTAILGGVGIAQKALTIAKGDGAPKILGKIAPPEDTAEIIQEISSMDPRQIFNAIQNEQPQIIAYVISYLEPRQSAAFITMLPEEQREVVLESMGGMSPTSPHVVSKIATALKQHEAGDDVDVESNVGGIDVVAELMNAMKKNISKELLIKIEERNPAVGAQIRKKMFGFEDLTRLSIPDMQRIAREIEMSDLVLAMKTATPQLQDMIFNSVSKRAAETLKEEMEMLGAVKKKDVEAAQDRVIQVVRKLDEEGEITIDDDEDEDE